MHGNRLSGKVKKMEKNAQKTSVSESMMQLAIRQFKETDQTRTTFVN